MRCPLCDVDLLMAERQGVEIDYCPQCRGIWLDRGELDKIIARAATEFGSQHGAHESAPPREEMPPAYREERHASDKHTYSDHGHKKRTSPASFLGDFFEF